MRWYWIVLLVLPPLLAPFLLPPFGQRLVTLVGVYALMGVGYQRTFGQLGALNLAQGALFGVGAYAVALTAPMLGALAFVVAALAAVIVAAIAVAPILRLQSHYFALATLSLAALVNLVAVHAESLTGGANGLVGFASSLPRGAALLVGVWSCLIAVVLVQAYFFAGRRREAARLVREAGPTLSPATRQARDCMPVSVFHFSNSWCSTTRIGTTRPSSSPRRTASTAISTTQTRKSGLCSTR